MAEEIIGEFRIVGYVDDLEVSVLNAKKQNMPLKLIDTMNEIHGDIVEIEPYLSEQEDYDALTDAVENLIALLLEKCCADDSNALKKIIDKLRKKVDALKIDLME